LNGYSAAILMTASIFAKISSARWHCATTERDDDEFSLRGGTQNEAHSPADAGYARA